MKVITGILGNLAPDIRQCTIKNRQKQYTCSYRSLNFIETDNLITLLGKNVFSQVRIYKLTPIVDIVTITEQKR
jgi:hypothetical protein